MADHSYKPALLRSTVSYDLGPEYLVCHDGTAEKWRLDWSSVTRAAFVEHKIRGSRLRRLDLLTGPGKTRRSIGFNGTTGDPASDPDSVAHLDLLAAILDRLAERDPAFPVTFGEYGKARLAIFLVGVASAIGAIGLVIGALASGVSMDRLQGAVIPVGLLLLFGVVLAIGNAPWRVVPRLPAPVLAMALRQLAHPGNPAA